MGRAENNLSNQIRVACSDIAVLFRIPAGQYYAGKWNDGIIVNPRPVRVAVTGYSDLSGYRRSDGRAIFIEVKTKKGIVSDEQKHFINTAKQSGCLAGIARNIKDAKEIINGIRY